MSANAHKAEYPEYVDTTEGVEGEPSLVKRILLIDEQAHVLRVIRMNLDRHGFIVDLGLNSENALLLMREQRYDALIMTSDLPDLTTRQLCDTAARYCCATVPLILVIGSRDDEWIDHSSGVERLETPVSLRCIETRLQEVFGTAG